MAINLALGRTVTISETPNASYPEYPVTAIRSGDADWSAALGGKMTDGQLGDASLAFTRGYLGFNSGTDITFALDLGAAAEGEVVRTCGYYGTDGISRPVQAKLESSDNGTVWSTVTDWDSLAGGGQPGVTQWMAEFDVSAAGSHRYWQITLQRAADWLFVGEMEFWS